MTRNTVVQRVAAATAALAYATLAVMILANGTGEGHYDASFEYLIGYLFVAALLSVSLAVGAFRNRSPRGAALVVAGALLVAFGVMWGNVTGEDPEWFALFGVPGNLLVLAGCVLVARRLWQEGANGVVLAVLLVGSAPASLVAAELGGGFVAATLWALVAAGAAGREPASPSTAHDNRALAGANEARSSA